ncbi:hypothetical protein M758_2G050800 [Ceratodon purpureus]|nr:hypothetical protein M758_2G050800 [Ceratodon purpureus]
MDDFVGRHFLRFLLLRWDRWPRKLAFVSLRTSPSDRERRSRDFSPYGVSPWSRRDAQLFRPSALCNREGRWLRKASLFVWTVSSWAWIVMYDVRHSMIAT